MIDVIQIVDDSKTARIDDKLLKTWKRQYSFFFSTTVAANYRRKEVLEE
jgi:hypothetical protein